MRDYALPPLTAREREILDLLAEDRDLNDIAAILYISHATVRNHVQHILAKLGVHSILEAVALYLVSDVVNAPSHRLREVALLPRRDEPAPIPPITPPASSDASAWTLRL